MQAGQQRRFDDGAPLPDAASLSTLFNTATLVSLARRGLKSIKEYHTVHTCSYLIFEA